MPSFELGPGKGKDKGRCKMCRHGGNKQGIYVTCWQGEATECAFALLFVLKPAGLATS